MPTLLSDGEGHTRADDSASRWVIPRSPAGRDPRHVEKLHVREPGDLFDVHRWGPVREGPEPPAGRVRRRGGGIYLPRTPSMRPGCAARESLEPFESVGIFANQEHQCGCLRIGLGATLFPFFQRSRVDAQFPREHGS